MSHAGLGFQYKLPTILFHYIQQQDKEQVTHYYNRFKQNIDILEGHIPKFIIESYVMTTTESSDIWNFQVLAHPHI